MTIYTNLKSKKILNLRMPSDVSHNTLLSYLIYENISHNSEKYSFSWILKNNQINNIFCILYINGHKFISINTYEEYKYISNILKNFLDKELGTYDYSL